MDGIKKVISADIKGQGPTFALSILLAGLVGLISAIVLSVFIDGFKPYNSYFVVGIIIFTSIIVATFSTGASMTDTAPLSLKLGVNRKDVALGLLIKDMIYFLVIGLLVYLLSTHLVAGTRTLENFAGPVTIDAINQFSNLLSISTVLSLVMGAALIFSTVSYMEGTSPTAAVISALTFIIALYSLTKVNVLESPVNIIIISLFIVSQIFRYVVIVKTDSKL